MAKKYVVTAPQIVVYVPSDAAPGARVQRYLGEGAEVPDSVLKEHVDMLEKDGLIAPVRQARSSASPAPGTPPAGAPSSDLFDPAKANQDEVLVYLATADEAEVARVKAAEADGQNRQKIAAFEPGTGD
ncbi:hypothetical protein PZ938_03105 [Luteipulveratus sp. YIM 133132]|uniref:hypothetical protein n=1 Tax=Luteipulveratus flavus TaxID=3031728 RepID=UPI0023AFB871|nr:hypothetical protein [Luteipulveratus sp. YIM 133132]MDE9364581.1 hypothetical protein [Luteipulveratus sp. YIM 133132]